MQNQYTGPVRNMSLDELIRFGGEVAGEPGQRAVELELRRREFLTSEEVAKSQKEVAFDQKRATESQATAAEMAEFAALSAQKSAKAAEENAAYTKEYVRLMRWSVYILAASSAVTALISIASLIRK